MNDRLVYPAGAAAGEGSALLRAAAAAGYGLRVRELLDDGWSDSARNDVELMLWAADYGAYQLIRHRVDEHTTRSMWRIARAWVGVDPVAELRRRLGDATAEVQRHSVPVDHDDHTQCIRATAADGRWAQVQTAHLAILTCIEERLGIGPSRDELMARALADRDPTSINWSQSQLSVNARTDAEATLRWATRVLTDPDPDARRFAAEVVHSLSIDQAPCRQDALAALRAGLAAEPDADVLVSLIGAAAEYHGPGFLPEVVMHAEHPDPSVRSRVAGELCFTLMEPGSRRAGVDVLAALARDPDGRVRAAALHVLRDYAFDHPVTGQVIAANRDDPDARVRVEALAGLARGGDTAAYGELRRLGDEAGKDSPLALLADAAEGWLRNAEKVQASSPDAR
ncbi:HEAT repeat domain-containing protein [Actinoplanes teichomyceticus]|uniref:HEAT repeat protein n=1 Tax=Actinoplanes teichomyceticus TaxID=1867 RepID=A0A561VMT7_ACTTI|nr:HEAT repeat domain-containing protein [Actinoplanes teichomyceticus]TWG12925.1 hypothetical protein FHX34_105793 [Actinoplanes teichomyceticus]GIF13678.1 hypothetical protein Ate01nite_37100 [Actinoplanes teichomyceticus]